MRRLVPVIIAALAITLAACGGGSTSSSSSSSSSSSDSDLGATRLIAASADKAAAAKTARISGQVTVALGGQTKTLPIDGALDFGTGAFEFSYDMSQLGLPGGGNAKIEARMVDGVMYMNLGDLGGGDRSLSELTGGKTWMKLDLASLGAGGAGGLGNANPGGVLDSLRGAGSVEQVGTEKVRGVETTHYRATIDPQKALAQAPADLRDKVKAGLNALGGPLPVDVWIDGDGQARRVAMTIDAKTGKVSTTMEYFDFGTDVDVTAPPADDVFDFSEVLGRMRGFAGAGSQAA